MSKTNYQQGKEAVHDLKKRTDNLSKDEDKVQVAKEDIKEGAKDLKRDYDAGNKEAMKDKLAGAYNASKEVVKDEGLWEKTKEVIIDTKDKIIEGVSAGYDKTKEFFGGEHNTDKDLKDIPAEKDLAGDRKIGGDKLADTKLFTENKNIHKDNLSKDKLVDKKDVVHEKDIVEDKKIAGDKFIDKDLKSL